jgi:protein TonB
MRLIYRTLLGLIILSSLNAAPAAPLPLRHQTNEDVSIRCSPLPGGVILKRVTPTYPPEARAKGVQGLVRISVQVGKNGVPQKFRVLSGPSELVNASLDALRQWRYKPYKLNGKAVVVETSVDINYAIPAKKPAAGTKNR